MSDLISRKALLESLKIHFDTDYGEDGRLLYSDHICTGEDVEDLIKLVNSQPTAYDIDKVVEQLEDFKNADECPPNDFECAFYDGCGQCKLSYAIEIVKEGGAV